MGRPTLNVLLSFAQFERELISERVRDKVAASKKKGLWMGGMPPLGYDVENRKLIVNEDEAHVVVDIFRRYLTLKSVHALRDALRASRNSREAIIAQAGNGRWNTYAASDVGADRGSQLLDRLPSQTSQYIKHVSAWVRRLNFSTLVKSIYNAYPEMRANSIFRELRRQSSSA